LNNKFIEIYFIIDNLYPFDDIFNIKLSRKLSKKDVGMFNLDKIRQQLYKAYEDGFELKEAFVNKKIKFYQSIYYEIKMENDEINRIKIGVGDTIEIEEEMSELPTFAIVRAVVAHEYNDRRVYPFFYLTWYNQITFPTNLFDCPKFQLCEENYQSIFTIKIIDKQPKVHFVHDCTINCTAEKHDDTSKIYLNNIFFYNPV
jgi:hypothetical protein